MTGNLLLFPIKPFTKSKIPFSLNFRLVNEVGVREISTIKFFRPLNREIGVRFSGSIS